MNEIEKRLIWSLLCGRTRTIRDLSASTGFSVPTITTYLNKLCNSEAVICLGKSKEEKGRQAAVFGVNPDYAYFIGIDVKHHEFIIAAMDFSGAQLALERNSQPLKNTPEMLETICVSIETFISNHGLKKNKIALVNLNLGGRVNTRTGFSYSEFNFEDHDEPLATVLSRRLEVKVCIENDTRAMAFGEWQEGCCTKMQSVLFINAGWGIGMSIILEGKQYYGADGYAGELGHTNVYDNQIICHCGKKGCLETEISGRALSRKLREALAQGKTSILPAKEDIDEYAIIDAVNKEDALCIELIEQAGAEMGRQIANLINIFNPEAVVVGGSLLTAGDYYFQPLVQAVRKYSLRLLNKNVKILKSTLGEQAGVRGACLLARKNYISLTF